MGEVKSIKSKILVILMIFMLMFSYYGFTFAAIATSEEFQVISNGFFRKDEMSFNAYFEDENGNRITETNGNVNSKVKLVLELTPEVRGFLKSGSIKAVSSDDGRINFKFGNIIENSLNGVSYDDMEETEEEPIIEETEEEVPTEEVTETEIVTEEIENDEIESEVQESDENVVTEEVVTEPEEVLEEESTEELKTEDDIIGGATVDVVNELRTTMDEEETSGSIFDVMGAAEIEDILVDEDVLVDEDALIDETKTDEERVIDKKAELDRLIAEAKLDIKVVADNEISVNNVIEDTRIVVELEFKKDEMLSLSDLSKLIKLQLSGTFINSDLEEVKVGKEEEVTLGWTYSKDISLTSEFTKFSPFELGDISGSIVENKITLTRDVKEENYLPIETTTLEIIAPTINDNYPTEVDVSVTKLLATTGQDIGETNFTADNWRYNPATGKIIIQVTNENNGKAEYTFGSDEYVIIYRFKDHVDTDTSTLSRNVKATVKEYSAVESTVVKELNEKGDVKAKADELITYSISSSEDHINKASIYANYNSDTGTYETEFTNQVTVHMLTSDVLESLKINLLEDVYKDASGLEFDAREIVYKKLEFNFSEVRDLLQNGGEIQIFDQNNNLIYTLDSSLINSEADCTINLGYSEGIVIVASGIARNGILNFEVTKAITKSNYEKSTFKNFKVLESRINAEVKYQKIDQVLPLEKIGTTKIFDESSTNASLSMNKNYLSTIYMNEDVELKIELNNDKPDSDLYVNPSFEIVFPRYITEVNIKNVNLLSTSGLSIENYKVAEVDGRQRIIVNLSGSEVAFSESTLTNGTNIMILADIGVDVSAPSREDQIKLYYCNEGVSTYEAQTTWSIEKTIPVGILKTTNGFDGELFKYQAPSGVVTTSGIINYDGNKSEIRSVKQGEKSAQIPMGSSARIAQMELQVMNNTDNELTDLLLIGRIPFKGAKDPITNNSTGSNIDTVMTDKISEDINNTSIVEFYYSENAEAGPDIANGINAWKKNPADLSKVKSFLIEVKGTVKPGTKLKFTYDFEIPGNLPYESDINGAFGAVYNRKTESTIVYESSSADKVFLRTEAGPKVTAKLMVDAGDGTGVAESSFLNYTLVVKNEGSVPAENVHIINPLPMNGVLYKESNSGAGQAGYEASDIRTLAWDLDKLDVDEEVKYEYMLQTGLYNHELDENQTITNQAKVEIGNFASDVESNVVSNKILDCDFGMETTANFIRYSNAGDEITFYVRCMNIADRDLENITAYVKLPKEMKYKDVKVGFTQHKLKDDSEEIETEFDGNSNTVIIKFDKLYKDELVNVVVFADVIKGNNNPVYGVASFKHGDNAEEKGTPVEMLLKGPELSISQTSNLFNNEVTEGEDVEILIDVTNTGNGPTKGLKIKNSIEGIINNPIIELSGFRTGNYSVSGDNYDVEGFELDAGQTVTVKIKGVAPDVDTDYEKTISNISVASSQFCSDMTSEMITIKVLNNPNRSDEPERGDFEEDDGIKDLNVPGSNNGSSSNQSENASGTNNNGGSSSGGSSSGGSSSGGSSNGGSSNGGTSNGGTSNGGTSSSNSSSRTSSSTNSSENTAKDETYKISGIAWIDADGNGQRDINEKNISGIKVQLLKNSSVMKVTTTNGNGVYEFSELSNGTYSVVFNYDSDAYNVTTFGKSNGDDSVTSKVVTGENNTAVSGDIKIASANVENISIGLVPKDTFNFRVDKYLSKAVVTTSKSEEIYEFDNETLSKIEIKAKELEGATVKLTYNILITNIGDIEGSVKNIVDYLPKDMTFNPDENEGWYLGDDGNVYNNSLSDVIIKPGNKSELTIVLTKKMTENNTGTVSNKVALIVIENARGDIENTEDNVNTQETLILIKTGSTTPALVVGGACVVTALAAVVVNRKKIFTSGKPTYSNKSKDKKKIFRKSYK